MRKSKKIITNQEAFFNQNAQHKKSIDLNNFFNNYANKEQMLGFDWIADCKKVLEYGCGTGTSLDVFFKDREKSKYDIYGVDIAQVAVRQAKENYPEFTFYKISNNEIPQIKDNTLDAVFMFHVLHHTDEYKQIFTTIYKKLKKNGKFLINDLSSNNAINKSARSLFVHMPGFVKKRFGDDLVVGESIPEKYKVNINLVLKQLKMSGFEISQVGYGHLFFFIFVWIDKFIPLSKNRIFKNTYTQLIKFEEFLLRYHFFQKQTEVFYVKCIKKN